MRSFVLPALLLVAALSAQSRAAIQVNNWTIDLDGAFGTVGTWGTITGIDQIGVTGLFHQQLDGAPAPGTRIAVDGLIQTTGFIGGSPAPNITSTGKILSSPAVPIPNTFEMTASFSLTNKITSVDGDVVTFVHEAAGAPTILGATYDGFLDLYLDNYTAGVPSNVDPVSGGIGFEDGTPIARFGVKFGDEGVLNTSELDGNDSATFELVSGMAGVLFDSNGVDLTTLAPPSTTILLAVASTTLDLDNDDNGIIDAPKPANWPGPQVGGFAFDGSGSFVSAFGQEDGSVNLFATPEPTMIAVWLGLASLGACSTVRNRG